MVRTNQPFVQRMALIWHDWFATSNNEVENQRLMLDQYELFVRAGRGSFEQLVREVTMDPAMCVFLNTTENRRGAINENYGRELMELFTLGADRGAYTETEVRELARSLSGWTRSYTDGIGYHSFRFDPNRWDTGNKTVFGQTRPLQLGGRLSHVRPPPAARLVLRRQALELLRGGSAAGRRGGAPGEPSTSSPAARSCRWSGRSCATRCSTRGRA